MPLLSFGPGDAAVVLGAVILAALLPVDSEVLPQ